MVKRRVTDRKLEISNYKCFGRCAISLAKDKRFANTLPNGLLKFKFPDFTNCWPKAAQSGLPLYI